MKVLTALGAALSKPQGFTGNTDYHVVPKGFDVQALQGIMEPFMTRPLRIRATRDFRTPDSFSAYVNRFKQTSTVLLGNPVEMFISAIIDYHEAADKPEWCLHIAQVQLTRTPEWTMWLDHNKKRMGQVDFAEFIENASMWINKPPAADLLQIARHMSSKRKMEFDSAVNLQDGTMRFKYLEESATGTMEIPEEFSIRLRLFQGGLASVVEARFRYRINSGQLVIWYELKQPEEIERQAFEPMVAKIEKETGIKVLI